MAGRVIFCVGWRASLENVPETKGINTHPRSTSHLIFLALESNSVRLSKVNTVSDILTQMVVLASLQFNVLRLH